ncbi:poly-beta-1,6 N-acetyl-D-glucosamine export porin PgaA [uncultured Halomonas sp.]|uniref:poly-beta-1,6 N-acetyl-D-glucosamine export porin PgaA n=1 Tax=uncultured Halomonas sp. TaxID=173971 RepID=UPI00261033EF|nr:poly-beta-1,6 N-acetyl-D-glucosamine export porin PgaA [uncultured Halomonas sp.]
MLPTPWQLLILLGWLCVALPALAQTVDARREALVAQAGVGEMEQALQGLRRLHERTEDPRVRDDWIALLVRAGRPEDALSICPQCPLSSYSQSELLNLGGAARAAGQPDRAIAFFGELTRRAAYSAEAWLGMALASTDLERYPQAAAYLERYRALAGITGAGLEAQGYLAAKRGDIMEELLIRQAIVEQQPDNEAEFQALYRLSTELGASQAARRLLERHPERFTASDRTWLTYHDAVTHIRLGIHIEDHRSVQRGLDQLDSVLGISSLPPELKLMANQDKVVALSYLRRFAEAEALSQRILAEQGRLPAYVLRARAQALAGLGKPESAVDIYWHLLDDAPERGADLDDPLYESLFYSYTDARQFRDAQRLLEEWRSLEPDYRWDFTGTVQIDNPNLQKVLMMEALLQAWRGSERDAHARVDAYLAEAPANPYLWLMRGDISRWRGWPRQAREDYAHAARLLSPEQQQLAHHGELLARLQQGDWRVAVPQIREALRETKPGVTRDTLAREWREQRAAELTIATERSSGTGSTTEASREWINDVVFKAPRDDNGSRFYARRLDRYGKFDADSLRAGVSLVGYEWNLYPSLLDLSIGHGDHLHDAPFLGIGVRHDASDQLNVSAGAELNSLSTPLRALDDGIDSNRYHGEFSYRRDERHTLGGGLSIEDFDDGNLRRSAYGYWDERLLRHDAWQLASTLSLSGSRNSDIETRYFNPRRDLHLNGRLGLSHDLPLGYRKTFSQQALIGAGRYHQQGFSDGTTWELGYRHRWEFSPTLVLEYGIGRERSRFDGQAEYDTAVTAAVTWRFP